ncbi:hypothetical protein JKF63_05267 [Porcisia hertigi]|uniref:Uncharacterized protein n=1 Tax=Porcisia hertigi TaxID=2761500 RepID=A0A836IB36_9TRYP|nr:hypothetical protein JKF63_05267 [Porcisia hertigi]
MSDRRVVDTAVADSDELVLVLLHVFEPLFVGLATALTNATSVMPSEVVRVSAMADGAPRRSVSSTPAVNASSKAAAIATSNTQGATGTRVATAVASSVVSGGAIPASLPPAHTIVRGSFPLQSDTAVILGAVGDEAQDHRSGGGGGGESLGREAQQTRSTALVEGGLALQRDAGSVTLCDTRGIAKKSSDMPTTPPPVVSVVPEAAVSILPSSRRAVLRSTAVPSALVSAKSDKAPTTTPRKCGRPPLAHTVSTCSKNEAASQTLGIHSRRVATPTLGAAARAVPPFYFTISNSILWEAVAALAEAVLIDGACFSWLRGELQRRAEDEQQRNEVRHRAGTTSQLPSPARLLTDALLSFDRSLVSLAHVHWRELTGFRDDALIRRGDSADEPNEGGGGQEVRVFGALPPEMQDILFTSVLAALVRAAAVYTAQLLSPLCTTTPCGARLAQISGNTLGWQQDGPGLAHDQDDSQSFAVPSRGAEHVALMDGSCALGPHAQVRGSCGVACASCSYLNQYPDGGFAADAKRESAVATGSPVTFRMVQETLKEHHRRALENQQQQQQQQLRSTPMPATEAGSPTSVSLPTAPSATLRASGQRKDSLATSERSNGSLFATAAGLPRSHVSDSLLELVVQQAEAQDNSCFYVQMSGVGCDDDGPHTEATATLTATSTAARATEFTVHVLCSALSCAMVGEATTAAFQDSASTTTLHSADVAAEAAGSGGIGVCVGELKKEPNSESGDNHRLPRDARSCLVWRWCAGLEQLACTASHISGCSNTSLRSAPGTKQSSFTVSASSLFSYLRDSSVNPQLGLLADYALETGKATPASKAPRPAPGDTPGGDAATADPEAATVDGAVHQSPWTTAQWSVRPVVGVGELDYPVHLLEGTRELREVFSQGASAPPSMPTDSAADAYPLTGRGLPAHRDTESPREATVKQRKIHADQVAPSSPRSLSSVEWLRLSDSHAHPLKSGQVEAEHDSAPPPPSPSSSSTAQLVVKSTAALFKRVLLPTMAMKEGDARASADVLSPLEEVGTVLATLDAVCAGRTLVDSSAWRYGRNRMNVAAVSIIGLTASGNDDDEKNPAQGGNAVSKARGRFDRSRTASQGPSDEGASLPSAENGCQAEPMPTSREQLPLGLYQHECGVLHVADGSTYALEVD